MYWYLENILDLILLITCYVTGRIVYSLKIEAKKDSKMEDSKITCTYSFMPVCSQIYWLQTVAFYSLPDTWEEQRKLPNGREKPRGPPSVWWYSPQLMRQGWFCFVITEIVTVLSARFACFCTVLNNLLCVSGTGLFFHFIDLFSLFFLFPFQMKSWE